MYKRQATTIIPSYPVVDAIKNYPCLKNTDPLILHQLTPLNMVRLRYYKRRFGLKLKMILKKVGGRWIKRKLWTMLGLR